VAPKSAASRYVLGLVEQHAGEWVLARNAWLEALEQDEDFIPARLALAREALRQGDAGGAEQYVVPAIREEPANLRGLCLYARVLLAQERLAAAKTIANRAVAVNKAAPEPRIILGEIALQQKDYAGSLLQFERALIQDPQSEDALDGLVRVYRRGEITRPMLRDLEKQAQSAPQSATLMELAGRLYADHGWSAGAKRCFRRALEMDPSRSTAAAALVRLLSARGETHTAIELTGKVGGYTTALVSGFTAQKRNDPTAAIAHYETALREGEQSGVAANNLAWLYAQQNTNLDRALSLALRARKAAPSDPAVLDTVGFVYLRRREYSQAIDVLKGAASLAYSRQYSRHPELAAEIARHLSQAYLRAGLPAEVRPTTGPKP
jgi:tetratricopeptide (TPR) repeat protein